MITRMIQVVELLNRLSSPQISKHHFRRFRREPRKEHSPLTCIPGDEQTHQNPCLDSCAPARSIRETTLRVSLCQVSSSACIRKQVHGKGRMLGTDIGNRLFGTFYLVARRLTMSCLLDRVGSTHMLLVSLVLLRRLCFLACHWVIVQHAEDLLRFDLLRHHSKWNAFPLRADYV